MNRQLSSIPSTDNIVDDVRNRCRESRRVRTQVHNVEKNKDLMDEAVIKVVQAGIENQRSDLKYTRTR